jgi:indolepyruvate ferredoxin oxidoreductase
VADASATIEAGLALDPLPELTLRPAGRPPRLLPPVNLDAEHDLLTARLERALEYARAADLNRITFEPSRPRFGVLAAGIGYHALLRALDDLGLDGAACEATGVRIVQLAMPWPLDHARLRELTAGLEAVFVVEDKLPFIESQLKEALYRAPHQPLVLGKQDRDGRPLLPVRSTIGADEIARALLRVLPADVLPDGAADRLERVVTIDPGLAGPGRLPTFCSGCPHNISTRASEDQLVGAGIGCHIMVTLDEGGRRGRLLGMPQMGGEGAQWFGLAPFTTEPHFIQNLGDGTFHHSGSLAIRAAVAADVNITYRLLYNDAVAMTGGQQPAGNLPIPDLVRELAIEGVKRVIIATPEPERYRGVTLDAIATVRHRDDLERSQRELAAVEGVTVLLYDDRCATEKRRLRKRGKLEAPAHRAWINERVCEGCGDCGDVSSCVSVQPVETPFGRKTQIHQGSCNQDMSCLDGDCPSFLLVTPDPDRRREVPTAPAGLAEPAPRVGEDVLIRMPGVGGTGVVTISAILQMAAHLHGKHAAGLEQTGLAQKGGPVISDLRIATEPITGQIRASHRSADVLIGFDLLAAAAPETLAVLDPERTVAVLNTDVTPTAAMVTDVHAPRPDARRLVRRVRRAARGADMVVLDAARVSERLFGDHMPANMLLVGAAYQQGCIPIAADAIERAIELNGAAVELNRAAFRWGRTAVADPARLDAALASPAVTAPATASTGAANEILADVDVPATVRAELERLVPELVSYQDADYARRYAREVEAVAATERARTADRQAPITTTYARGLFKLMAYKDEYEVARLHLDAIEQAKLSDQFGAGAKVQVLVHPPLLRALGLKRKLRLRRSAKPLFTALRAGRKVRGTRLDPFGYAHVRRIERALINDYRSLVARALERLTPDTAALVVELVGAPDIVRGYEQIKLRNIARMRERADELIAQIEQRDSQRVIDLTIITTLGSAVNA